MAALLVLALGLPPGPVVGVGAGGLAAQEEAVAICRIQGAGASSPLEGQMVLTTGVVTANFVATDEEGFFLQQPQCDLDPATSDGIFVYTDGRRPRLTVGQQVEVTGEVKEHYGLTEILLEGVTVLGMARLPAPVTLEVPRDADAARVYLEAREGMLVALPVMRVVGATNDHGESYVMPVASGVTRLFRSSNDGRRLGLMAPGHWLAVNHGDRVSGIQGPLYYSYGSFKVAVPDPAAVEITPAERQPPQATPSGPDEITIATYNLENFFDPIDDPGTDDGGWTPTAAEYETSVTRRARSIGHYLAAPDLVAVQEVEKLSVLQDLAGHPLLEEARYGALLIEGPDRRGIDVGLLYNRRRFRVLSVRLRQECTSLQVDDPGLTCPLPEGSGWVLFSRPPLVVRLASTETGARLSLIINHFKSKRGGDDTTTAIRLAMADFVRQLVTEQKAAEPETPVIVLGDLNDFQDSPPVVRLTEGNLLRDLHQLVPPMEDFTYVFSGISQNLDYILVEPEQAVFDFRPLHINTDYASPPPGVDDPASPRASDHDPLLLTIPLPGERSRPLYLPLALHRLVLDIGGGEPTATPTRAPTPTPTRGPTSTATRTPRPTMAPPPAPGFPPRSPLRIDTVLYDGMVNPGEPDEYVMITNVTATPVGLAGWQLISVRGNQRYAFPSDFAMAPGQSCRVYTNEYHPEHCGLSWGSGRAIWRNSGDKAELRDGAGGLIDWFCYGDYADECQ